MNECRGAIYRASVRHQRSKALWRCDKSRLYICAQTSAILEVTSLAPGHRIDILNWCREMGHDCFQMSVDGDHTWFWIKQR